MQNQWWLANQGGLEKVKRVLTEMEYLPIFQDYPVRVMQALYNGFENELNKVQEELNQLKIENKKLKNELDKIKKEAESESA